MAARRPATALAAAVAVTLAAKAPPAQGRSLEFEDLAGWSRSDMRPALTIFRAGCAHMEGAAWARVCSEAPGAAVGRTAARTFFEKHFRPVLVGGGRTLFTGYYEPELEASPVQTPVFGYPIYRKPPELRPGTVWYSRATIENRGLLRHRGLALAWLADPVDVFFLQVQGSGRLRMPDGSVLRVGFAARNGRPYRSVGMEMVRRGILPRAKVSAQRIRAWVRAHPEAGRKLLQHNPSYIFFRKLDLPASSGPIGAMGIPITAGRSLAVDPAHVPLGAPVWIETDGARPIHRLMVAQDTGTAIRGPRRADVFIGPGAAAGRIAGSMRDRGRMVVLMPRDTDLRAGLAGAER